jgi:hypothetical protein
MSIEKVSGCNQMFCVQCHTAFDWATGEIETGVIHNPHYFDMMKRNQLQRNPQANQLPECRVRNQMPDPQVVRFRSRQVTDPANIPLMDQLVDRIRTFNHLQGVVLRRLNTPLKFQAAQDKLLTLFALNRLSDKAFADKTFVNHRHERFRLQQMQIYQALFDIACDIMHNFLDYIRALPSIPNVDQDQLRLSVTEALRQIEVICADANDRLKKLSAVYNNRKVEVLSFTDFAWYVFPDNDAETPAKKRRLARRPDVITIDDEDDFDALTDDDDEQL